MSKKDEKETKQDEQVQEDPTVLNDDYEYGGGGEVDGEEEQPD